MTLEVGEYELQSQTVIETLREAEIAGADAVLGGVADRENHAEFAESRADEGIACGIHFLGNGGATAGQVQVTDAKGGRKQTGTGAIEAPAVNNDSSICASCRNAHTGGCDQRA